MKNSICYLVVLFSVFSCNEAAVETKGKISNITLRAPSAKYNEPAFADTEASVDEVAYAAVETSSSDVSLPKKTIENQIIRTADLRFETSNISNAFDIIQKAISKNKATVQEDNSGKDENSVFRNITLRVHNSNFLNFIQEISQGIDHFDRKNIASQDVTQEYIDLESRMNSKKTLEKRYLQLLSKANKVSEMIEIERKLAEIREEIEAKEGQFKYMKNQIAMSTVSLEMYTNNALESGETASFGGKIWNSVKQGLNGLSSFLLGIINIWPFILIFVVVFLLIRKKFKKQNT